MTLFYLFAAAAGVGAVLVLTQRNPIFSVLLLIASFRALWGVSVLLDAPFAALAQLLVSARAIMVLFSFVVMLLSAPHEETERDERGHALRRRGPMRFGAALAVMLVVELVWALTKTGGMGAFAAPGSPVSSVRAIGRSLFT